MKVESIYIATTKHRMVTWLPDSQIADEVTRAIANSLPRELGQLVVQYSGNYWRHYFNDMRDVKMSYMRQISFRLMSRFYFFIILREVNCIEDLAISWQYGWNVYMIFMGGEIHIDLMEWSYLWDFLCGAPSIAIESVFAKSGYIDSVDILVSQLRAQIRMQVIDFCVRRECAHIADTRRSFGKYPYSRPTGHHDERRS